MKKIFALTIIFSVLAIFAAPVLAADPLVVLNKDNIKKGMVTVKYTGSFDNKIVVCQVKKDGETVQNNYFIKSGDPINIPFTQGVGKYKLVVAEGPATNKIKVNFAETLDVTEIDEKALYTATNYIVNFNDTMKAITSYKEFLSKVTTGDTDKINSLYNEVTADYTYDHDKAKVVGSSTVQYVPVLDDVYKAKMGICYDYSVLFACVMRSQGIPARVAIGFSPDTKSQLHAWNEIYIGDKWVTIDTTVDAAYVQAKQKPVFAKDGSLYTVEKRY